MKDDRVYLRHIEASLDCVVEYRARVVVHQDAPC